MHGRAVEGSVGGFANLFVVRIGKAGDQARVKYLYRLRPSVQTGQAGRFVEQGLGNLLSHTFSIIRVELASNAS